MKESVRESFKRAVALAAIGLVAALVVSPLLTSLAATMGVAAGGFLGAATVAGVLGSALVFGGFGILYPRLKSLFRIGSGIRRPEIASETSTGKVGNSRQIDSNTQPDQSVQTDVGEPAGRTFSQKLDAERIARKADARLCI